MKSRKDRLIEKINVASGDKDLLLDFMNLYGLDCLIGADENQLEQYICDNRL